MRAFHPIPPLPGDSTRRCAHLWASMVDGVETTHCCRSPHDHRGRHRCACGVRHAKLASDLIDVVERETWAEITS